MPSIETTLDVALPALVFIVALLHLGTFNKQAPAGLQSPRADRNRLTPKFASAALE